MWQYSVSFIFVIVLVDFLLDLHGSSRQNTICLRPVCGVTLPKINLNLALSWPIKHQSKNCNLSPDVHSLGVPGPFGMRVTCNSFKRKVCSCWKMCFLCTYTPIFSHQTCLKYLFYTLVEGVCIYECLWLIVSFLMQSWHCLRCLCLALCFNTTLNCHMWLVLSLAVMRPL